LHLYILQSLPPFYGFLKIAASTVDDKSRWQPDAYSATHRNIANSNSDSSSSSSDDDDDEIIEDWTTTPDEYDNVEDHDKKEKKDDDVPVNFIPETQFCKFFHQFTLDHQRTLLNIMETKVFNDGEDIVTQGEEGDCFYVIKEGEAAVVKRTSENIEKKLTHLYKGQSFGEIALIYGGKRVASVRSVGRCTCLSLSKNVFEKQHDVRMFLVTKKVPMLADLDQKDRLNIIKKLQPRTFVLGDYVIREGDKVVDDAFYMITKGEAAVVQMPKNGEKEKILTRLFEGHCFGEMALVSDETRSASIVAKSAKLQCMCLTKQDFQGSLAGGNLSSIIEKFAKERRKIRLKRVQSTKGEITARRKSLMRQNSLSKVRKDFKMIKECKKSGSVKKGTLKINQYRIGKALGKGSYSTVYLGFDTENNDRKVAVKVMDKHALGKRSPGQKRTLLDDVYDEISCQKVLYHEGIVQLICCIDDPKQKDLYLIQECVEGGEILVKEPLQPDIARKYFRDLLRGVEYMHSKHVVHRDIKPENILLTSENRTKIADFGTAHLVKNGSELSVPKGTPAFMAPELLSYDTVKYSGRPCDIWSLGATLYMLVVGVPPFMANNEIELAKKVKYNEVTFPEECHHGEQKLNPHLMHLIKQMLEKNPEMRPCLGDVMIHEWVTAEGSEPLPPLFDGGAPRRNSLDEDQDDEVVELIDIDDSLIFVKESGDSGSSDADSDYEVVDGFDGPQGPRPASNKSNKAKGETKNIDLDSAAFKPLPIDTIFPRNCTVKDVNNHLSKSTGIMCSAADNIGVRSNMEDKTVARMNIPITDGKLHFFAIFDGHGGDGTSSRLQLNLPSLVAKQKDLVSDVETAIVRSWHIMDWEMLKCYGSILRGKRNEKKKSLMRTSRKMPNEDNHLSGATAAVVVVIQDNNSNKPSELIASWAGDSRIVLGTKGGGAVDLSEDHKASRLDEKKRVQRAGGSVDSKGRVGGDLAVSRAFGDIMHKGAMNGDEFLELIGSTKEDEASKLQSGPLICTPDIKRHMIESEDEFLILASDGIWDVLTSQQAVLFVRRFLAMNGGDIDAAASALVKTALASGTVDNVSAVIVALNQKITVDTDETPPKAPQTTPASLPPPTISFQLKEN
jgi:serine/threonine protein kinase/serine/threonine protein phosphatase PrpC/CRP-like cAMP-binding protein